MTIGGQGVKFVPIGVCYLCHNAPLDDIDGRQAMEIRHRDETLSSATTENTYPTHNLQIHFAQENRLSLSLGVNPLTPQLP